MKFVSFSKIGPTCTPLFTSWKGWSKEEVMTASKRRGITLRELVSGVISVVDALWIDRPIGSKDIVLARLVSIAGFTISLGPVILLPAASRTLLQRIVEEDRALVNRWNDDYIEWDTYRARYAGTALCGGVSSCHRGTR